MPVNVVEIILLAVVVTALCCWIAYIGSPSRPPEIAFEDGSLVVKHKRKIEKIPLSELAAIRFHYHAVVGFVATWEFISKSGQAILVSTSEVESLFLMEVERHVSGFSVKDFREQFDQGDVEDTLDVWSAA